MSMPVDSIGRLDQAEYYLPYQTTSIQAMQINLQAMETLAGGVGYGAPRHLQRPALASKKIKKKSKSRFNLCGCVGNVDMYDDGLNTSFVASSHPGEKIIGSFIPSSLPPMPSVEYAPGEGDRRKRSKMSEQLDSYPGSAETISSSRPNPNPKRQMTDISFNMTSQASSYDSNADILLPTAKIMTAIQVIPSETNLQRAPSHDMKLTSSSPCRIDRYNSSDAPQDGFYPAPRAKSSFALVCDSVQEQEVPPKQRQKRRGGFIASSSSSIPIIDVEEASFVEQDAPLPFRSSLASTMSKYSVMSPCIDYTCVPSRATMGGEAGDKASISSTNRSSLASTNRTLSIGTHSSLQESPDIGDVLSHFPNLPGMAYRDSSALARYTSEVSEVDDEASQPKRINTFGLDRRRDYDYKEYYSTDRINSFHYDEGNLALDLCRRPSSPCDSSPSSTPSSSDSIQTSSSGLSSRSQKRSAVMRRLPSHHDLAALSRCSDVGDLTWEERLLKLSRGRSSSSNSNGDTYSSETPCDADDDTIEFTGGDQTISQRTSKETLRRTRTTQHKRVCGSSTSHAPFSPPPNLPLPPVPSKRKTSPQLRSPNSLLSIAFRHHSSLQQSSSFTLPRSTTCPDLSDVAYAY